MNYYDLMSNSMYGNNSYGMNSGLSPTTYDRQLAMYQQQLQMNSQPQPNMNNFTGSMQNMNMPLPNMMPQFQQPMYQQQQVIPQQQPNINNNQNTNPQQNQNDLYLQSLFMEFLRSPEMKDFTDTFTGKFAQFYKNKTGLDYPVMGGNGGQAQQNASQPQQTTVNQNFQQPQPQMTTQQPVQQVNNNMQQPQQQTTQPQYIIEKK